MSLLHISSEGIGDSLKAYCGVARSRGANIETARPWEAERHNPEHHWCPTCVRHATRTELMRRGIRKRANWYRELADPKVVGTVLHPGRHPQAWALGAAGATGAGAHTDTARRHAGTHDTAADAALGALAGQSAYQAAGYAPSHYARHKVGWNTRLSAISDPDERTRHKTEDKLRKESIRRHTVDGKTDWTAHYRNFPAGHRYSRVFRTVGRTHRGRTGVAIGAAATAAGAALGARHGHRQHGPREMVGKAAQYGVREHRISPVRAVEEAAGVAGVAWGLPRLKMLGPAIAHGAKLAEQHGGAQAARATVLAADTARAALTAGSTPLEQIRRLRRVNHMVEAVPTSLRPAVATVAGAILAVHAHPVRHDVFVPAEGPR